MNYVAVVVKGEMHMDIGFWGAWILLILASIFDVLYRKIPFLLIICGALIGVMAIFSEYPVENELFYALLPGMFLLMIAFLTREKVGYGDGLLILDLGLLEGAGACLEDLLIGLFLVAIFGITVCFFGRKVRDVMVPFAPFLFVAHIIRFGA